MFRLFWLEPVPKAISAPGADLLHWLNQVSGE